MKTKGLLFAILFCLFLGNVSAQDQEVPANSTKEDRLATLLDSHAFEFIANRAFPTNGTPKNIAGNGYTVSFSPEMVISTLPYYGRAYSIGRNGDKGMRFKGIPEEFKVDRKNGYQLNTTVTDGDTYKISLSVNESGFARLTISSNDRATIIYQGEIVNISE